MNHWIPEPAEDHPSDYALIRYMAGELGHNATARVATHLETCSGCRDRVVVMDEARESFEDHPRAHRIRQRMADHRARATHAESSAHLLYALAAVVALAMGLWLVVWLDAAPVHPDADTGPIVRTKGVDVLWVVQRGKEQLVAGPDFGFEPEDRIGIRVTSPKPAFATVFSITNDGRVRLLRPRGDVPAEPIPAGRPTVLHVSLVVDAPVEPERVFVLLSSKLPDPEAVVRAGEMAFRQAGGIEGLTGLPVDGTICSRMIGHQTL